MVADFTAVIDQMATASGMTADECWASFKESMEEGMTCSEGRPYTMSVVTDWEPVDEAETFGDTEFYVNNKKRRIFFQNSLVLIPCDCRRASAYNIKHRAFNRPQHHILQNI